MNIKELETLIRRGESEILEFKKSTAQLQAAFETVSAFLNGLGGTVLIGVNDAGKIIGQDVSDTTKRDFANAIKKIEPAADAKITIEYLDFQQGKKVIVVNVKAGDYPPYTYDHRPYQRSQSSTVKMPQHGYEQMMIKRAQLNHDWESFSCEASLEDLDQIEIKRSVISAVEANRLPPTSIHDSISDVLTKLELLKNGKISNAAMVLFAKSVNVDFPQCMIKMARFKGVDKLGDFIDSQMVSGNAFEIMKAADEFIMRHLPIESFFDESKLERIDKPFIPVLAIREALCNAVCHRDYSIRNASIMLSIFDDRMEIWNNGSLIQLLTLEDLKKRHQSYPRNRKIAKVFYLRNYIETWGTGTTKMIDLCKKHEIPEPIFDEYSGGFSVTFKFKTPLGVTVESYELEHKLKPRQKAILAIIRKEKSLSIHSIMKHLDNPPSERMVRKDLSVLKKLGLIQLEGYGRSALWTQGK